MLELAGGFAHLKTIKTEFENIYENPFEDAIIRIEAVPLSQLRSEVGREHKVLKTEDTSDVGTQSGLNADLSVAYICKPRPKQRKMSFEKCVELNIPRGPLIGQLKDGYAVTLPDGRQIQPEDVLEAAEPNLAFIILECPSDAHVDSLVSSTEFNQFYRYSSDDDEVLDIIVHMTPSAVAQSTKYRQWMAKFGPDVRHMFLNDQCSDIGAEAPYRLQALLNHIHPGIFPLLPHQQQQTCETEEQKQAYDFDLTMNGCAGLKYILRSKPNRTYDRSSCVVIKSKEDYIKATGSDHELLTDALEQLGKQMAENADVSLAHEGSYPQLLFLGTGSAIPSKARNVSGLLLHIREDFAVLVDCGEGTYGQLYRHYGDEQTRQVLRTLRAVFVTHLHADHHTGLVEILRQREEAFRSIGQPASNVVLVAPQNIVSWLEGINQYFLPLTHMLNLVPAEHLVAGNEDYAEFREQQIQRLQMRHIEAVKVFHRKCPFGYVLTTADGFKIVVSGDTRPSENLVAAGQGCDILIHEATMEDGMENEAAEKRHSTTSQAIDVGKRMNASFTLLTHFSQRYAKIPVFNENFSHKVGIAFDNMKVSPKDIKVLPCFFNPLKIIFAEEYASMEFSTLKRTLRQKDALCSISEIQ